jgi:ATP-binding cassette subfamily B multidrug efflux pump
MSIAPESQAQTSPSSFLVKTATLWTLICRHKELFLPYRGKIILGVITLTLTNLLGIAIPWQIKQAVDELQRLFTNGSTGMGHAQAISTGQWDAFYLHLGLLAGLAFLTLLARIGSRVYLLGAGRHIEFALRQRLYAHLLGMPPAYFAAHPAGELMSRVGNDVDATKSIFGGGIMLGLNTILAYVLTIPLMLALNWPLALLTFFIYPFVIAAIRRISREVRAGFAQAQSVLAEISQSAQESLAGISVIQSYALENQESDRFATICDRYRATYDGLIHNRILLFLLLAALSGVSMTLVLLVGGGQVIGHKLDWGGFVAFTMYLEHLAWPTMALGYTLSIYQQGTAALQRIDDVLSTQSTLVAYPDENDLSTPEELPSQSQVVLAPDQSLEPPFSPDIRATGLIEFRHLNFAYTNPYLPESDTASRLILKDLSLTIQPGETVGFVGPVGSGKSTLLHLLPRLYDLPAGSVFLDGLDITRLAPAALRARMVLMPQSSFLFSSTVARNIAFGHEELDPGNPADSLTRRQEAGQDLRQQPGVPPEILEIAELAAVSGDIEKLPSQYETLVGERGLILSGGQRQRVALARTLLAKAEILILDDPFSNVDADTEQRIVGALQARRTFSDRTTLLATHRFSLLALCDRVALMDAGRLIAIGTADELLATQPLYRRLAQLQSLRAQFGEWDLAPDSGLLANIASVEGH